MKDAAAIPDAFSLQENHVCISRPGFTHKPGFPAARQEPACRTGLCAFPFFLDPQMDEMLFNNWEPAYKAGIEAV